MIIRNEQDVTVAVLSELDRAQDSRWREIMQAAVRHLHAFVREARLTEREFQQACGVVAQLGQHTTAWHNEVVLAAGSVGISSLVCLLNNGEGGQTETTANLLGPFWRAGAPRLPSGACIAAPETPGEPLFVSATVCDVQGQPVAQADLDVWHTSAEGFYDNQDPGQPDMNLRGIFTTDDDGRISFRTVRPAGYPIPVSGPVGSLLRAQGRHNLRPAHIHFMVNKPGYKTQFSQVYSSDDPNIETDVQFGVTQSLVGHYVLHEGEPAPSPDGEGRWYSMEHRFVIEPGEARLPHAPITGRAEGSRPSLQVFSRRA